MVIPMKNTPDSDLVGVAEAVEILGITRNTIYDWVKAGKLTPAVRMPGTTGAMLFKRSTLEAHARSA
jgi:excisionase family DNA binding protein